MAGPVIGRHRPAPDNVGRRRTGPASAGVYLPSRIVAGLVLVLLVAFCLAVILAVETAGSPAPARPRFVAPTTYGPPGPTGGPR